jgi:hypothetical protein
MRRCQSCVVVVMASVKTTTSDVHPTDRVQAMQKPWDDDTDINDIDPPFNGRLSNA